MNIRMRRLDLVGFLAVLVTGVVLIALGVSPEAMATVSIGLSGLYGALHGRDLS